MVNLDLYFDLSKLRKLEDEDGYISYDEDEEVYIRIELTDAFDEICEPVIFDEYFPLKDLIVSV